MTEKTSDAFPVRVAMTFSRTANPGLVGAISNIPLKDRTRFVRALVEAGYAALESNHGRQTQPAAERLSPRPIQTIQSPQVGVDLNMLTSSGMLGDISDLGD